MLLKKLLFFLNIVFLVASIIIGIVMIFVCFIGTLIVSASICWWLNVFGIIAQGNMIVFWMLEVSLVILGIAGFVSYIKEEGSGFF